MTVQEWAKELKTYKTPYQVATESVEGIEDHINAKCNRGHTRTATHIVPRTGGTPFHEEPTVCNRGTSGCNLFHDEKMALEFSRMAFKRILELTKK